MRELCCGDQFYHVSLICDVEIYSKVLFESNDICI